MNTPPMTSFLAFLFLILGFEHVYIFHRLSHDLALTEHVRFGLGLVLILLFLAAVAAFPIAHASLHEAWSRPFLWGAFSWLGVAFLLFACLLVADVFGVAVKTFFAPRITFDLGRMLGLGALTMTILLSAVSFWNNARPVAVKNVEITLNRLPHSFDGFRLVQISDIHIGPTTKDGWLEGIVERVNALNPDMIVVTGDLADGSVYDVKDRIEALSELKAPQGIYFVTGNHDYYSGVTSWCEQIRRLGIRVLRNEHVSIQNGRNDRFVLAGVDDQSAHRFPREGSNLAKALTKIDPSKAVILLSHQPSVIKEASHHGVDLVLSGHTHGGQIWPFGPLVYLQQPYLKGLHRPRNTATQIYVSAGTGYWGPPMRLGSRAEITHITLRTKS